MNNAKSGTGVIIENSLEECIRVKRDFIKKNVTTLVGLAEHVSTAFKNNKKLLICGNGGSASDAQHIAAEFVNRFQLERRPLPAIALTTDTSVITSIANDYGYAKVFSKQIEALGQNGDILLAISTSGRSENVMSAIESARENGLFTVGLTGMDGGDVLGSVDLTLVVESESTPRIQEVHIFAGHLLCELVEHILFRIPGHEERGSIR